MYEKKTSFNFSRIYIAVFIAVSVAFLVGFLLRPVVASAASPSDATLTDAQELLPTFAPFTASSSDADYHTYLTYETDVLNQVNLLLSIRNLLVCIWFTIVFIWSYDRLKAIIFRLGGYKKS